VKSTNQVQASHEPPSLRPHCSSAQQWVTPELGPSSTLRKEILTRLRLQGKPHRISGKALPKGVILRPLLPDSHSPHVYSTQGVTPSHAQSIDAKLPLRVSEIDWIRKSPSLKLVLDTLWKKPLPTTSTFLPRERSHTGSITICTGQQFTHNPSLLDYTVNRKYRLGPPETSSAMETRSQSVDFQDCSRDNFHRELPRLPSRPNDVFPSALPRIDSRSSVGNA
jgi:hypothetical protein